MKWKNPSFFLARWSSLVVIGLVVGGAGVAQAAGLDAKESEQFRRARQLYKSGNYQDAADIFSNLSAAHPDMPHFTRNAGAAYYYLKKPDPALSNLREYLRVQKNLTPDDREEVEKWIAEMERLRAQTPIAPSPAPGAPPATFPVGQPMLPPQGGVPPGTAPSGHASPTYYPPRIPGSPPAYPPGGPGVPAGVPAATAPVFPGAAPAATAPVFPGVAPAATAPVFPEAAAAPAATYPAGTPPGATVFPGTPPAQPQPYPTAYSQAYPGQATGGEPSIQAGAVEQFRGPEEPRSALPWLVGGAGVATIALGGVFTYLYRSAYADTRAQYDPDRESAGRTYSYLQFVCYGLGAAGVATGAILLLRADQTGSGAEVTLAPALGPRLAGAQVHVRY